MRLILNAFREKVKAPQLVTWSTAPRRAVVLTPQRKVRATPPPPPLRLYGALLTVSPIKRDRSIEGIRTGGCCFGWHYWKNVDDIVPRIFESSPLSRRLYWWNIKVFALDRSALPRDGQNTNFSILKCFCYFLAIPMCSWMGLCGEGTLSCWSSFALMSPWSFEFKVWSGSCVEVSVIVWHIRPVCWSLHEILISGSCVEVSLRVWYQARALKSPREFDIKLVRWRLHGSWASLLIALVS